MNSDRWASWLRTAFGFESLFLLFLAAGVLKATPLFAWSPIDLTLVFLLASVASGAFIVQRRGYRVPRRAALGTLAFLLLAALATMSLAWSPSVLYATHKTLHLAALCGWSFIGASFVIAGDDRRIGRFFSALVVFSAITAVQVVALMVQNPLVASQEWGKSYLGFGRLFGAGLLVLVAWLVWKPITRLRVTMLVGIFVVLATGLLVGGGRGPLLAVTIALAVPLRTGLQIRAGDLAVDRRIMLLVISFAACIALVTAMGEAGVFLKTVQRIAVLLTEGDAQSFGRRLWYYGQAGTIWMEAPVFGHGIGAWPVLIGWGDVRAYPHNIVLELLVELGALGLAIFGTLVAVSVNGLRWSVSGAGFAPRMVMMFLVAAVSNALLSGDLPDNRVLFAALGLCAGLARRESPADG